MRERGWGGERESGDRTPGRFVPMLTTPKPQQLTAQTISLIVADRSDAAAAACDQTPWEFHPCRAGVRVQVHKESKSLNKMQLFQAKREKRLKSFKNQVYEEQKTTIKNESELTLENFLHTASLKVNCNILTLCTV
jgi:hypothetical protein